jgi:hypothetical protein
MTENTRGRVFIASKNMRGKWARHPVGVAARVVDVTSAQFKASKFRHDFSPMQPKEGGYKAPDGLVYFNFEHFWQGGKVWPAPAKSAREFFLKRTKPTRRLPGTRGKLPLHAKWDIAGTGEMQYVESRKRVYVPFYHAYMQDCESLKLLKQHVDNGGNVVVYDFDGPRLLEGETDFNGDVALPDSDLACMEVTPALLRDRINNTKSPFGHGYVVAASLAGIPYETYCD